MNAKEIEKLELWIVTSCLTVAFLFTLANRILIPITIGKTDISIIGDNLAPILFNYLIIYISYLFLVFHVRPELDKEAKSVAKSVVLVYLLIVIAITIGIINIYWATLLALKLLFILFSRNKKNKENDFYTEAGFLTSIWILSVSALYLVHAHQIIKLYAILVIPIMIISYFYALFIAIPKASTKQWKRSRYFLLMLLLTVLSTSILVAITVPLISNHNFPLNSSFIDTFSSTVSIKQLLVDQEQPGLLTVLLGNFLTQLIITTPIAWKIYKKRNTKKTEEIITLKTELGKADANLNFLKSQINPHFLFNALNTLYGTALQEKADRTGEGIQKLGDMMRFMLQENMEDKISLSKDVDYLNNYIELQKLRTSSSSEIIIETQIEEQLNQLLISPMILIPFVENAFKHGISLQSPSHIKITLQTSGQTLYFDVHNSIHSKHNNDPEKLKSGIGLQNVKQRLALIYPDQHELIIRENAKEFFIHLTLQLSEND